ncbi:hypothetical protein SARC_11493 [Sphaeroforma arctica JP610]|uniref:Pre-mRNA-splicing factor SPF27 n=1 Tax=Sphaeroforma arctica JP610 TaxID=667725 RepID=A0A0L0FHQ1_9EUKA|nr:hypothetical protein SARC_11493 [Sphaeroforma arctica JP610]KNC75996.1 hypothetical protein SARC_11493 [Sphaeroforma arctica JP610]|eukprot:XP_014149898.1 hypothetical protein SARC_11493 [Sphaeroforma arctica JP610]
MDTTDVMMGIGPLPYVDSEYESEDMRAMVDAMIEDEASKFPITAKNYLSYLGQEYTPKFTSELLKNEYARVSTGKPMAPFDVKRYKVAEPTVGATKEDAWRAATDHVATQLEMQHDRIINLELLIKYGKTAWLEHTKELELVKDTAQTQLEKITDDLEELNGTRAAEQQDAGMRLLDLQAQLTTFLDQKLEVQKACYTLERELQYLEQKTQNTGGAAE